MLDGGDAKPRNKRDARTASISSRPISLCRRPNDALGPAPSRVFVRGFDIVLVNKPSTETSQHVRVCISVQKQNSDRLHGIV